MSVKMAIATTARKVNRAAPYVLGVFALLGSAGLLWHQQWAPAALWAAFAAIFLLPRPRPAWYLAIAVLYAGFGAASVISGDLFWGFGQFFFAALWGWYWKMSVERQRQLL